MSQPGWLDPELATLTADPFSDPAWIYERKFDGERCLAFRDGARLRLMTRNQQQVTGTYPEIAEALAARGTPDPGCRAPVSVPMTQRTGSSWYDVASTRIEPPRAPRKKVHGPVHYVRERPASRPGKEIQLLHEAGVPGEEPHGSAHPGFAASALDTRERFVTHPEIVTSTVRDLTGAPAHSFADWAAANADAFR